jgi:hypothetical protein
MYVDEKPNNRYSVKLVLNYSLITGSQQNGSVVTGLVLRELLPESHSRGALPSMQAYTQTEVTELQVTEAPRSLLLVIRAGAVASFLLLMHVARNSLTGTLSL